MNVSQPLIQSSLIGEAIDGGPLLVFVADEEMQYVAVNDYACTVLGYSREELLGMSVPDVTVGPGVQKTYRAFLRAGEMAGTVVLRHRDGTELPFAYRARETTVAGMTLYVSAGWIEPA